MLNKYFMQYNFVTFSTVNAMKGKEPVELYWDLSRLQDNTEYISQNPKTPTFIVHDFYLRRGGRLKQLCDRAMFRSKETEGLCMKFLSLGWYHITVKQWYLFENNEIKMLHCSDWRVRFLTDKVVE